VAESLDLSPSTGRMFANLLAMFAQFERERMSERRAEASKKLYSRGGYNGGSSPPWGYKTIQRNGRLELEPDADQVAEIRVIVDKVLGRRHGGQSSEHEPRRGVILLVPSPVS
jgi:site-specific DNA recombinase